MNGIIVSGQKKGKEYISSKGYKTQIKKILNITPYDGTLNVKIDVKVVNDLKESVGINLEGFIRSGIKYGSVLCFPVRLFEKIGYIVLPEKTDYNDTIEIIAEDNLREKFELKDGDRLDFSFEPLITYSKKIKVLAHPHIGNEMENIVIFYDHPFSFGRRDLCQQYNHKNKSGDTFYNKTLAKRKIVSLLFHRNKKTSYKQILQYLKENNIFLMSPLRVVHHSVLKEWQIEVKLSGI